MPGYNIDSDLDNADWSKRTWDFYGPAAQQANMVLSGHGSADENFTSFMKLPVARAMPDNVRDELRKRGYKVPTKDEHAASAAKAKAKAAKK